MLRHGLFLIIIFLLLTLPGHSQVAVNTSGAQPNGSAILDVNANDKGLLIPRVEITDVDSDQSPVENPAAGLLVFNVGSTDGIPQGFYFWNENKWNHVTIGSSELTTTQLGAMYEAAELYEDNPFASPTTINLANANNKYGWKNAIEGEMFGNASTDLTNTIADRIIIGEDGLYTVEFSMSFSGSNNSQLEGAVWIDPIATGVPEKSRVRMLRKLASSGDIGSGSAQGLIRFEADDEIYILFQSQSWGESVNIYNINLIVNKVGE